MIDYRQQRKMTSSRRRRRGKRERHVTNAKERQPEKTQPSFGFFSQLPRELKLHVLSFIAEASMNNKCSTLTHIFPLVSREFHDFSKNDCLWQAALERLVETEPYLWKEGFMKLCNLDPKQHDVSSASKLVRIAHQQLHEPGYFRLYRMMVARCMRFTAPIFCMANHRLELGTPTALHFFEPRYRLLVQMVMEGYPADVRDGRDLTGILEELPSFVYAHVPPYAVSSRACLVEVHRCTIDQRDGTANVLLMPVAFVKMERIWERPNTGHLFFAQCVQLSQDESNELARQEVSRHVQRRTRATTSECMPCCIL